MAIPQLEHPYRELRFTIAQRSAILLRPDFVADGAPWIWRSEFFGHEPQVDLAMLELGWHVAYIDCPDSFGNTDAMGRWDALYRHLTEEWHLSPKPVLESFSRGGLYGYSWASLHPDCLAAIYADAPVCDIKSWPLGLGEGTGDIGATSDMLAKLDLTLAEALEWRGNPIDVLAPIAAANIPIVHVCGDADDIVPMVENSSLLGAKYITLGGRFELIVKTGAGHHPHSLADPAPIVSFVARAWNETSNLVGPRRTPNVGSSASRVSTSHASRKDRTP